MENILVIDMESIITSINDVVSSKIITNDFGEIEEMHVISYNDRSPKQISRDIQSLLIAKFDQKIDYKKISIAQINSDERIGNGFRVSIGAIGCCLIDNTAEIKVVLNKGEEAYESTIMGPKSKKNIYRLVVQATLECIHKVLGKSNLFIVEDIVRMTIASQEVVTIAITHLTEHDEVLLVGSAILKKDGYEAIVKATLDAVNRKLLQLA